MNNYHLDLREELCVLQKSCPGCGIPSCTGHDLHHLLIRRVKKNAPFLYSVENCSLVCQACHTGMGEKSNLNYGATIQKFRAGITPEQIEKWVEGLPLRIRTLPAFYHLAKEHHLEFIHENS